MSFEFAQKRTAAERVVFEFECGRRIIRIDSPKDGGKVSILATPCHLIPVIDIDDYHETPRWSLAAIKSLTGLIGYMKTPNGFHLYADNHSYMTLNGADPTFETLSRKKGYYGERLFNEDGTPRMPEIILAATAMVDHATKIMRAQLYEIAAGRNRPEKPGATVPAPPSATTPAAPASSEHASCGGTFCIAHYTGDVDKPCKPQRKVNTYTGEA